MSGDKSNKFSSVINEARNAASVKFVFVSIFLSMIVSLITYSLYPENTILVKYVVVALCFAIIIIAFQCTLLMSYRSTLYDLSKEVDELKQYKSPSVVTSVFKNNKHLLIVSPSPFFSVGVRITVYIQDGEFENPIANGLVWNIQQNKLIVIVIDETFDLNVLKEIENKSIEIIKKLIVKPLTSHGVVYE